MCSCLASIAKGECCPVMALLGFQAIIWLKNFIQQGGILYIILQ